MHAIENITLVGLGALGILFGNFFSRALGEKAVTFVANSQRRERYMKEGVTCNGNPCHFRFADPGDVPERPADLLLFAVKATALDQAIEDARNSVGGQTIILSLLNGITSEQAIAQRLGMGHVLGCVAQGMDAVRVRHDLTYAHQGVLVVGAPAGDGVLQEALSRVTAFFDGIGLPYVEEKDILRRLYSKWMLNVGVNQVVMVCEGTYRTVQQEGKAREMMKAAMREAMLVARAEGVGVTQKDLDGYVALVDTLSPDGMPSMRQDGLARRRTEVESFAGTVIAKAARLGIDVPVNRELYARIRAMEAGFPS